MSSLCRKIGGFIGVITLIAICTAPSVNGKNEINDFKFGDGGMMDGLKDILHEVMGNFSKGRKLLNDDKIRSLGDKAGFNGIMEKLQAAMESSAKLAEEKGRVSENGGNGDDTEELENKSKADLENVIEVMSPLLMEAYDQFHQGSDSDNTDDSDFEAETDILEKNLAEGITNFTASESVQEVLETLPQTMSESIENFTLVSHLEALMSYWNDASIEENAKQSLLYLFRGADPHRVINNNGVEIDIIEPVCREYANRMEPCKAKSAILYLLGDSIKKDGETTEDKPTEEIVILERSLVNEMKNILLKPVEFLIKEEDGEEGLEFQIPGEIKTVFEECRSILTKIAETNYLDLNNIENNMLTHFVESIDANEKSVSSMGLYLAEIIQHIVVSGAPPRINESEVLDIAGKDVELRELIPNEDIEDDLEELEDIAEGIQDIIDLRLATYLEDETNEEVAQLLGAALSLRRYVDNQFIGTLIVRTEKDVVYESFEKIVGISHSGDTESKKAVESLKQCASVWSRGFAVSDSQVEECGNHLSNISVVFKNGLKKAFEAELENGDEIAKWITAAAGIELNSPIERKTRIGGLVARAINGAKSIITKKADTAHKRARSYLGAMHARWAAIRNILPMLKAMSGMKVILGPMMHMVMHLFKSKSKESFIERVNAFLKHISSLQAIGKESSAESTGIFGSYKEILKKAQVASP